MEQHSRIFNKYWFLGFFQKTLKDIFISPSFFLSYKYFSYLCMQLLEHFRSSTESSDARLAESLARLCKHTLRTQICIYDSWTHQEHTSQAICYLVKSALNSILEEPPTTSGATSTDNEQEADSDDLPSPTELCALIPSDVNTGHQDTFLANVLKYTHDGRDAQLAWLRELDTCSNYYEFQAGTDVSHEKNQLSYQHSLPSTWRVVWA